MFVVRVPVVCSLTLTLSARLLRSKGALGEVVELLGPVVEAVVVIPLHLPEVPDQAQVPIEVELAGASCRNDPAVGDYVFVVDRDLKTPHQVGCKLR